jgi:DNA-binding MarR family transcriptional regulator
MGAKRKLPFDPIDEARRHWEGRWGRGDAMAAATAVMRVQQIVLAAVDEALRPFDLTFARYEALVLLQFSRKGSLPLGKMGERLMIHPTSVTNIVDRLEAQGFIKRVAHPTDRRTTLAEITDAGRAVVEEATRAVTEVSFAVNGLTDDETEQLILLLRKLRRAAGDFADESGEPAGPD